LLLPIIIDGGVFSAMAIILQGKIFLQFIDLQDMVFSKPHFNSKSFLAAVKSDVFST
jgi:hypothetical protein